jgi:hypothetical protein
MDKETRKGKEIEIIETLYIPVPNDTWCVACLGIIPKGKEAIQSPSTPGRFYHFDCFRNLVRATGKDPDRFIKIITPESVRRN